MKRSEKKRKQKKVVLMFTLATAAVIVGGMTFAWFSSKDQVTNRLSASSKYGTSIVEDFQPPEEWLPGQKINKDAAVVNTGSVDAFVRMWLEGEMSIMKKLDTASATAVPASVSSGLGFTAVDVNDKMYELGFKYKNESNYYKVLNTQITANPDAADSTATVHTDTSDANPDNIPARFSEVQSVQAGGYLVYAPANAKWSYKLEQDTELETKDGSNKVVKTVLKGNVVGPTDSTGVNETLYAAGNAPQIIDSDTFKPETPGLYIFRRNIDVDSNKNTADTYEYAGYVFDGTNYFALSTVNGTKSDYVLPAGAVTATVTEPSKEPTAYALNTENIKLYTASETVVENDDLTWTYDNTANAEKLTATYGTVDNQIAIDVALANIGNAAQNWTYIPAETGKMATFYYNDDLEAGDTTTKLVDSATLSSETKKDAYIAFDFDLNVNMESVQVTKTEDGKESTLPVEAATATPAGGAQFVSNATSNASGATAGHLNADEIDTITWTAAPATTNP